jgi:hypothetical protein
MLRSVNQAEGKLKLSPKAFYKFETFFATPIIDKSTSGRFFEANIILCLRHNCQDFNSFTCKMRQGKPHYRGELSLWGSRLFEEYPNSCANAELHS